MPLTIQRVANVERAQMLMESPSRAALQRFLAAWQPSCKPPRQTAEHKGLDTLAGGCGSADDLRADAGASWLAASLSQDTLKKRLAPTQ